MKESERLATLILEANKNATGKKSLMSQHRFLEMAVNDREWNRYVSTYAENLSPAVSREFRLLAENTRKAILEQAVTGNISYYETFVIPVLSVFYPRLLSRSMVTVKPIDKPEVIFPFIRPKFKKANSDTWESGPSYNDPSGAPGPTAGAINVAVPSSVNLLVQAGFVPEQTTIQRGTFAITRVKDSANHTTDVSIYASVDGYFGADVLVNNVADTIHGSLDFKTGQLTISSTTGVVTSATVTFITGNELNLTNTQMEFIVEKIRLVVRDRAITGKWSLQFEQDIKNLYDINLHSQMVSIIGQQIALDIDREIVNHLIAIASVLPASHAATFYKTPPDNFVQVNRKYWYVDVTTDINSLASAIYADTNIAAGNILAINPEQAPVLEALDDFVYTYTDSYDSGEVGFKEATAVGGKFKILVSPVVPKEKGIVIYKPDVDSQVVYYYCPYVPAMVHPYPLQNVPTLTFLSRYATAIIRNSGVAILTFDEGQKP